MEATTGFEHVVEVLQTSALPLGYVAPGIRLPLTSASARRKGGRVRNCMMVPRR